MFVDVRQLLQFYEIFSIGGGVVPEQDRWVDTVLARGKRLGNLAQEL